MADAVESREKEARVAGRLYDAGVENAALRTENARLTAMCYANAESASRMAEKKNALRAQVATLTDALARAEQDGRRLDKAFAMLDRVVAAGIGVVEIGQTEMDGRPGICFPRNDKAVGVGYTAKEALLAALAATYTPARGGTE
jgi:hypothetical protein